LGKRVKWLWPLGKQNPVTLKGVKGYMHLGVGLNFGGGKDKRTWGGGHGACEKGGM